MSEITSDDCIKEDCLIVDNIKKKSNNLPVNKWRKVANILCTLDMLANAAFLFFFFFEFGPFLIYDDYDPDFWEMNSDFLILILINVFVCFIFNVCLSVGIYKEQKGYVITWLVFTAVQVTFHCVRFVTLLTYYEMVSCMTYVDAIGIGVNGIQFFCIYKYFQTLQMIKTLEYKKVDA